MNQTQPCPTEFYSLAPKMKVLYIKYALPVWTRDLGIMENFSEEVVFIQGWKSEWDAEDRNSSAWLSADESIGESMID